MRATGHRRDPFKAHINYQIYQRRNRKEPESEIKALLKLKLKLFLKVLLLKFLYRLQSFLAHSLSLQQDIMFSLRATK